MEKKIRNTVSLLDVTNLIDTFGINTLTESQILAEWEKAEGKISPEYKVILEEARKELFANRSKWNEEELKMNFISIVFKASQLNEPNKIQVFYKRSLSGTIQNYEFSIICDCMVATPTQGGRPKFPYFFLQEFKKGKGDKIDAEAQMLVAMLLAQQENKDHKPLYGAWLLGESWNFSVLNGNDYCVSKQYIATDPQSLEKIVFMLQKLKTIILDR